MADLPRVTAKIFAANAAEDDIGQYGSAKTGNKVLTGDIAQIQALEAFLTGWRAAVLSTRNYPTLQEMNGLQKVFSQQIAYILQKGMPEWDSATDYYIYCFCRSGNKIYYSLINNNIGNNPETDSGTNWKLYNPGLSVEIVEYTNAVLPEPITPVNPDEISINNLYGQDDSGNITPLNFQE